MNRKLIRPDLSELKEQHFHSMARAARVKKPVPPEQTNAESFYFLKQMTNKTRMVVRMPVDRARFSGVVDARDLDAHDALVQYARDQMNKRFMDAHDGRHFRGGEPRSQIAYRFEVERAVFHVDHAVVETGGFDDAWNTS